MKKIPKWASVSGAMAALAFFLRYAARGYSYIAYTLVFIAALIVLHHFVGAVLWRVILVLVGVGLMYFCVVEHMIISECRTDADADSRYVIVLGAAVYGDIPSQTLVNRMVGAMDYLETHPDSVVIVSGGQGDGEDITEAECMRRYLTSHGVEPSRILMEDQSTSTMENLQNSFEIIRALGDEPDGNVAVVSSSYHLYRAKMMAKSLGVNSYGIAGRMGRPLVMINYFIREAFGVTHLWVFGN